MCFDFKTEEKFDEELRVGEMFGDRIKKANLQYRKSGFLKKLQIK